MQGCEALEAQSWLKNWRITADWVQGHSCTLNRLLEQNLGQADQFQCSSSARGVLLTCATNPTVGTRKTTLLALAVGSIFINVSLMRSTDISVLPVPAKVELHDQHPCSTDTAKPSLRIGHTCVHICNDLHTQRTNVSARAQRRGLKAACVASKGSRLTLPCWASSYSSV